ncbi:MAG TPA: DUF202 domain-containing protein [Acidimicrobiia bacterium]|nr:DUF202 domain-containing protein [Acidimicrobiia bacterium]
MPFDPVLGDEVHEEGPGLYAERTRLAWTRSAIALLAAFAILVRRVWTRGYYPLDPVAFAFLGLAAIGWGIGIFGWRLAHRREDDVSPRSPSELLAVSSGTLAVVVAGLVVTFAG